MRLLAIIIGEPQEITKTHFMSKSLLLLFLISPILLIAQYKTVNLNFEDAYIGDNNPLPAETNILFTGAIPSYIDRIELNLLHSNGKPKPLHTSVWQRPLDNKEKTYSLPVNYKFRSSSSYDIEVRYFQTLSDAQRQQVIQTLNERLKLFLETQLTQNQKMIEWEEKPKRLLEDMNAMLRSDLQNYRTGTAAPRILLSDLVALQMEKMEKIRTRDSTSVVRMADEQVLLRQLLKDELNRMLPAPIYKVADARYLEDCPTESKKGALAVNAGYGGVYFTGEPGEDLDYDTAPFVGFSFPLGNSAFAPRFFSNTYLGFGVFLQDFENSEKQELTGPITGLPIYASLDHKLFQFIYLNIGATLLEENTTSDRQALFVRPFIGLSAKVNLSLQFER